MNNNTDNNKFYTCKYDRPFKEIMLKKSNRDILKLILEKILGVNITKIEENNIERNSGNIHVKRKYLDMLLTTNIGKIEIEVNACDEDYVHPRNASYICDIYSHHVLVKQKYTEDIKIIQINLSYGIKDERSMRIYKLQDEEGKTYVDNLINRFKDLIIKSNRIYRLQDESGKRYVENLIIYDVNMEYYKKIWYSKNEKEIEENKYMIMLDLEGKELEEISKKDKVVYRYMEEIVNLNKDPGFREFMTYEMDQKIIQNTRLDAAEKKGLERGIEKGMLEGERQEKQSIARTMLKAGEDIEKIMLYTCLTKDEIELLK